MYSACVIESHMFYYVNRRKTTRYISRIGGELTRSNKTMLRPDNLGLNLEIHPDALVMNQASRAGRTPEETRILKAKDYKLPVFTRYREGTSKEVFHFVQVVAPKFGFAANPEESSEAEKRTMEKLVASLNNMKPKPRFLLVQGNYTNAKPNEKEYFPQLESFKSAFENLSPEIPVVCVCGPSDCGDPPTLDGVEAYRKTFGDDWFAFWIEGVQFLALNTAYYKHLNTETESFKAEQQEWLESKLLEAQVNPPQQVILLQSIPWFRRSIDEGNDIDNIDSNSRQEIASKLVEANAKYVFAGHLNGVGKDKELEIIQTSSLAKTDDEENPGFRVVKVDQKGVVHKFFALDNSPVELNLEF